MRSEFTKKFGAQYGKLPATTPLPETNMTPAKHKPSESAVRAAEALSVAGKLHRQPESAIKVLEAAALIDQHCHLAELNAVVEAAMSLFRETQRRGGDADWVSVRESSFDTLRDSLMNLANKRK